MTADDAIKALNEAGDIIDAPERAHTEADKVLIEYLRSRGVGASLVADAWESAKHRAGFWYA